MPAGRYQIKEYLRPDGSSPYRKWLESLDRAVAARLQSRILRLETGNLGDFKAVGSGVMELRCHFGAGYRVYFGIQGQRMILLLIGGDKRSQLRDIHLAQQYWLDYLEGTS